MKTHELVPHIAFPPRRVSAVTVYVAQHPGWLWLRWRIDTARRLVAPPFAGAGRADGLWQTTCFELFLRPEAGEGYCEFNFSPSDRWNAYDFDRYRDGVRERPGEAAPVCTMRTGRVFALFEAAIPLSLLPDAPCAMGLSAVIEEEGEEKSFWALAQPAGHRPDFHDPACFAATLHPRGAV
ncbi:DOMON-like domain-containing protein [Erythrobacter sp. LQ02-29]|uniref:DOMON-like domain-containing protein n=1 Tax=Erythrobacter sp. LQ02-29 TaxID=2920384 RepID=UPI001F4EA6FB|nr:DOMON-like domain-containing protein [Erythrobacter sp. LQ02-29]MCP9223203.1 DOMON-like domain-containing protein [Erythrobacter sp. LQ02-29]